MIPDKLKVHLKELVAMKYFWHVLVGLAIVALIFFTGRSCGYDTGFKSGYKKGFPDGQKSIDCGGRTHNPGPL